MVCPGVTTKKNKFEGWEIGTDEFVFRFLEMRKDGVHVFRGITKKSYGKAGRRWQDLFITEEFTKQSTGEELLHFLSILMKDAVEEFKEINHG